MAVQTHSKTVFGERSIEAKVPGRTCLQDLEQIAVEEKRAMVRHRVLKGANIYFNRGYGAYSCTVKNLSDGGAMVVMEDSSGLPGEFDFQINGESRPRKATIGWRQNGRAGIRFI